LEKSEIVFTIEGAIGDQTRRAVGAMQLGNMIPHDVAKLLAITAIATEGLHQQRDTSLMLHDEIQHDLIEIRPVVAAIARSETHDALGRRHLTVVVCPST
jgi:hypothetical protein